MSAPDQRNDLSAFFKQMHESGAFDAATPHHSAILDAVTNAAKRPRHHEGEVFHWGVDHGKPGGDQTAYTRYSFDGYRIIVDELHFEDIYVTETEDTRDTPHMWAGRRPFIADLVARIGQKRCTCNAGYLIREATLQLIVCNRCDGFSTQRGRRFRARG